MSEVIRCRQCRSIGVAKSIRLCVSARDDAETNLPGTSGTTSKYFTHIDDVSDNSAFQSLSRYHPSNVGSRAWLLVLFSRSKECSTATYEGNVVEGEPPAFPASDSFVTTAFSVSSRRENLLWLVSKALLSCRSTKFLQTPQLFLHLHVNRRRQSEKSRRRYLWPSRRCCQALGLLQGHQTDRV